MKIKRKELIEIITECVAEGMEEATMPGIDRSPEAMAKQVEEAGIKLFSNAERFKNPKMTKKVGQWLVKTGANFVREQDQFGMKLLDKHIESLMKVDNKAGSMLFQIHAYTNKALKKDADKHFADGH